MREAYEILGLHRGTTQDEIKKAYRKLSLQLHPDKTAILSLEEQEAASIKFQEVSRAYGVLKDPQLRAAYDANGWDGIDALLREKSKKVPTELLEELFDGSHPVSAASLFRRLRGHVGEVFGFEPATPVSTGSAGSPGDVETVSRNDIGKSGLNLRVEVWLTLEELSMGASRRILYCRRIRCRSCHGSGAADGRSDEKNYCKTCKGTGRMVVERRLPEGLSERFVMICESCGGAGSWVTHPCRSCSGARLVQEDAAVAVAIPSRAADGDVIRFPERGDEVLEHNNIGCLEVVVRQLPHPVFLRIDKDWLFAAKTITLLQSLTGFDGDLPCLGQVPGTCPAVRARIWDRVIPSGSFWCLSGASFKFLFRFDVLFPAHLDRETKKALRLLLGAVPSAEAAVQHAPSGGPLAAGLPPSDPHVQELLPAEDVASPEILLAARSGSTFSRPTGRARCVLS